MNKFFLSFLFITTLINAEEQRAFITDITQVKTQLKSLGAHYKGHYSFTDSIYFPKDVHSNASYARIRSYEKSEWVHKKIVLTIKDDKQHVLFKDEYDILEEAQNILKKEFEYAFSFFRQGWEYSLGEASLFIEDIEKFPLSLEIVAPTKQEIMNLFKVFNATTILEESLPLYYAKQACTADIIKN